MSAILVPLAAFLWRLRGGLLNDLTGVANWHGANDTVVRAVYALGLGGAFWALHPGLVWWHVIAITASLFAGATIGWFGADVHLTAPRFGDALKISESGIARMAILAVATLSPWPLLVGVVCGPIYWIGSKLPPVPLRGWVWCEILFGAAIGAGLVVS